MYVENVLCYLWKHLRTQFLRKQISAKCCHLSCRTVYRNNNVSCESSCDAVAVVNIGPERGQGHKNNYFMVFTLV